MHDIKCYRGAAEKRVLRFLTLLAVLVFVFSDPRAHAQNIPAEAAPRKVMGKAALYYVLEPEAKITSRPIRTKSAAAASAAAGSGNALEISTHSQDEEGMLPTWTFNLRSPRDGNRYSGTLIGHSPFRDPQTDRIPTYIIPLVIRTHRIGIDFDPLTFHLTTVAGDVVSEPTAPDNTCLAPPNNVPVELIRQSPLFQPVRFFVAGTDVGTTQWLVFQQWHLPYR